MTWQECFEDYGYHSLIRTENNIRMIDIEMFQENNKVPGVLREVYLSSKGDELFLVLQPSENKGLGEFCNYWDSAILTWIQFGKLPGHGRDGIQKLKYNVTMLLLYWNKKGRKSSSCHLMDEPGSFELEKGTSVSRKVFLACGEDDVIEEDDKLQLPFWYGEFEEVLNGRGDEEKLNELLPKQEEKRFLLKRHEKIDGRSKKNVQEQMYFTDEEFQTVKGWLENV